MLSARFELAIPAVGLMKNYALDTRAIDFEYRKLTTSLYEPIFMKTFLEEDTQIFANTLSLKRNVYIP